jgi:purine-cytosine permease-like protein
MTEVRKGWAVGPIGFRDARLDSADLSSAMALFVAGIPSLLVGAELAGAGLAFGQLIIAAPLGAILGGGLIGLLGRQAASSGAPGAYLARAPFGSFGALIFNLLRLVLTLAWASIVIQLATNWIESALLSFDLALPPYAIPALLAVLAAILFFNGLAWTVVLIRRRLFWIVLALILIVVWRFVEGSDPTAAVPGTQSFVGALDGVIGLAVLWAAVGADLGGYGQREDETATGLGFGFAIGALAFILAGAALGQRVGANLENMSGLGAGAIGAVLLILWVPLMEVDGTGGLVASSGMSLQTVLEIIPTRFWLVLSAAAAGAGAVFVDQNALRDAADLAAVVLGPAMAVVVVDAYLVRPGGYSSDELFRWRGDYGLVNPAGLLAWVVGAAVALWLHRGVAGLSPLIGSGPEGLPPLLLGMVASGLVFLVVGRLIVGGRSETYQMRSF